ncbi:MAG: outer membrane beta-barrel protein [Xanthobacteraceae bacterium]|nr:outer membrane beta-barrel protein [Xanthobacteraceae bacterium]
MLSDLLNPNPTQVAPIPDVTALRPGRVGTTRLVGAPAPDSDATASSRIGTPVASDEGFDSLGRERRKPKPYPGAPKLKGAVAADPDPYASMKPLPRISPPPSQSANKPPVPPAVAGAVVGQPYRKRLKPDTDPFGAVGDYVGSFLVKGAVEVGGGYDSNPGRFNGQERGSALYRIAPELLIATDWERHAIVADLRGSFTGYGQTFPSTTGIASPAPVVLDRPDFTGKVAGRLDVTRDTRLLGELRLRVGTDNPGSPNIQAGLSRYPIYTTVGGLAGVEQNFNRLQVTVSATADHTAYQDSKLTNGTTSSNDDRNFNTFGGIGRVSYEVMPGLKPFGEVQGDTRVHETSVDRSGYRRDSNGGYAKVGTTFELTRLITGELAIGYAMRSYQDPRLTQLTGLLTSGSLIWSASPLTTVKFITNTTVDETTLPGVPGVLTRTYTAEVDHDFRRWLTGIGQFTYGTLDYQNGNRRDTTYSVSGDLIYKFNRNLWVRGTLRRDWLESTAPGNSSASTVVMLGVRVQN